MDGWCNIRSMAQAWLHKRGSKKREQGSESKRRSCSDLLRQLQPVRVMLLSRESWILFILVVEVSQRLAQVIVCLFHKLYDLSLLEGWRDRMLPVYLLRKVYRHAVPIGSQLLQRVRDGNLLAARVIDNLQDDLTAWQRRQVDVQVHW